jgi:hypothetical protein
MSVLTVLAVEMNLTGRNDLTLHLDFAWSCLYASYGLEDYLGLGVHLFNSRWLWRERSARIP